MSRFLLLVVVFLVAPLPVACAPAQQERAAADESAEAERSTATAAAITMRRGLWVLCEGSQRVLEHPERIARLIRDAEVLGVSDLFVQVYRGGRAWFATPRADATPFAKTLDAAEQSGLTRLIEAATQRGIRVHAWVNVLSLASNRSAPLLDALGRDVVLVDHKGRSLLDYPDFDVPVPDRNWYRMGTPALWLDPAAPGLRRHFAALFAELMLQYPGLSGLHLDYIRYADALPLTPGSRFDVGLSFGFGAPQRARFERETGLRAPFRNSTANAARFDTWRRDQLSALVASIASAVRAVRPGLELSAAVIADRERAYNVDFQDWLGWLDAGHLDFAVPMLYTRDPLRFRYGVEALAGLASERRRLWVGLGAWLFAANPASGVAQLRDIAQQKSLGNALFSWDSIHDSPALLDALAAEVARAQERPAAAR